MKRANVLHGVTYQIRTGCGSMYITINDKEKKPCEVFIQIGKAGGCAGSQAEALGRVISLGLRNGVSLDKLAKSLSGIRCHKEQKIPGSDKCIYSCSDAISQTFSKHTKNYGKYITDSSNLINGV